MLGLGVARGGATSNFVVYLVKKYNVPRVDAAQMSSIALGCLSLAPVGGAIIADAFFGCYPVVAVAMVFSVLVSQFTCRSYHGAYCLMKHVL
jgi:peptide/histidine transporter 3/4